MIVLMVRYYRNNIIVSSQTDMNDIFISYNWGSQDVVHKIVDLLKSNDGYKIWLDVNAMNVGDMLHGEIKKGIDNCKLFVAFITKKYCESKNCQFEIHYASNKNKKCIYVMLDKDFGQDPAGIELLVTPFLRLNGYECTNDEDIYKKLSKNIGNILRGQNSYNPVQNVIKVDIPLLVELCEEADNNYVRIKQLIEKDNANANYKDKDGYTALIKASKKGHLDTVKCLIQNGANVNEKNNGGDSALTMASWYGHLDTVEYLVQNGANVNEKGYNNNAAIQLAYCCAKHDVVNYLISKGANFNGLIGYDTFIWATENGHLDIVRNFVQHGAKIICNGLVGASRNGHIDTVKYLIQNGANMNEKNNDGETALIAAQKSGNFDLVNYLISKGAK